MTVGPLFARALLGLGVVAGAVLPISALAQAPVRRDTLAGRDTARSRVDTAGRRIVLPTAGRDTIRVPTPARADSMIRNDSIIKGIVPLPRAEVKPDSMKPPLTRTELPVVLEIGAPRIYDRTALFATGAVTMSDLLGRVPGLTEFSTGWLAAPSVVASQGDLRRIRLFLDGIELDPLDRRARGVAPVNDLPLHALEEVRIERGADEVRVYARSWRVDRTTPYTRADIATGDQNTNLYRAFFGRRYAHGEALQVSAEQFNTQPDRRLPSSDGKHLMARLGLVRGPWSADAFMERSERNRANWTGNGNGDETLDTIPGLNAQRTTSYLRLGNGDPDAGRWLQLLASANEYRASARTSTELTSALPSQKDSLAIGDSTSYVSQYLVSGGMRFGRVRASGTERIRVGGGRTSHVGSARASGEMGPLALSLFAEGRSFIDPARYEATARFTPLSRVALTASAARTGSGTFSRVFTGSRLASAYDETGSFISLTGRPLAASDTAEVTRYQLPARTSLRAEAGVRLRDLWLSVGVLQRGATTLLPAAEIDTAYVGPTALRTEGQVSGRTLTARGRIYRAIYADAWALAWNDSGGPYRPKYQTRAELYLQTNLLDRFPHGNFGLLTSLAHEYRSNTRFPSTGGTDREASGARTIAFKLEIRIQTAVVSYQFRNLLQERYSQVPGYNLPRQTQFYGIRWDFWN